MIYFYFQHYLYRYWLFRLYFRSTFGFTNLVYRLIRMIFQLFLISCGNMGAWFKLSSQISNIFKQISEVTKEKTCLFSAAESTAPRQFLSAAPTHSKWRLIRIQFLTLLSKHAILFVSTNEYRYHLFPSNVALDWKRPCIYWTYIPELCQTLIM